MSELNDKILEIKRQKDTYILPENLKKNITVFGVTGTLETSGGDVKLFDTVEHMQQDENPSEGDLAVVYREEIQPVTGDSEFSSCMFPNEVVLSEAFTGSISGRFRSTGSSYFDGSVSMSASRFRFNGYGESSEIRVQYTSSDGITYTRTDGGEELQEFGTSIKWEDRGDPFNDVIGNFMKIGGNYFEGLYRYILNTPDYTKTPLYKNGTASYDGSTITYSLNTTYGDNFTELFETIASILPSTNGILVLEDYNGTTITKARFYEGKNKIYLDSSNVARVLGTEATKSYTQTEETFNKIHYFDLSNNTHSVESVTVPVIDIDGGGKATFLRTIESDKYYIMYSTTGINYLDEIIVMTPNNSYFFVSVNVSPVPHTINKYINAPTQLDTTPDYVYEKTFYGKQGVDSGILHNGNIINNTIKNIYLDLVNMFNSGLIVYDGVKFNGETFSEIPFNIDTSNVTNMGGMFADCFNLTTIPQLDTSNVTNTASMFYNCNKFVSMPLLDTSNVTIMGTMFGNCSKLTAIPLLDTSKVTDMTLMFTNCQSLTAIPQLDTSNATNTASMFNGCISITTIPQLDTNAVTNMYNMFGGCTNLTTVPLLDTNSVTSMSSMFRDCPSLSNTSLNNILTMCTNSAVTSDKTLAKIGLSQAQAQICTTLSNYSAFTAAGWTTGY